MILYAARNSRNDQLLALSEDIKLMRFWAKAQEACGLTIQVSSFKIRKQDLTSAAEDLMLVLDRCGNVVPANLKDISEAVNYDQYLSDQLVIKRLRERLPFASGKLAKSIERVIEAVSNDTCNLCAPDVINLKEEKDNQYRYQSLIDSN